MFEHACIFNADDSCQGSLALRWWCRWSMISEIELLPWSCFLRWSMSQLCYATLIIRFIVESRSQDCSGCKGPIRVYWGVEQESKRGVSMFDLLWHLLTRGIQRVVDKFGYRSSKVYASTDIDRHHREGDSAQLNLGRCGHRGALLWNLWTLNGMRCIHIYHILQYYLTVLL